jgi:hypothetical protein
MKFLTREISYCLLVSRPTEHFSMCQENRESLKFSETLHLLVNDYVKVKLSPLIGRGGNVYVSCEVRTSFTYKKVKLSP